MKKTAFVLFALLFALGLSSCEKEELSVIPSGRVTNKYYTISNLDALKVEDIFEVYVSFSNTTEELVIQADDNLHHLVDLSRRNGTLTIGLEDRVQLRGRPHTLKAFLTTRDLHVIEGAGAVRIFLENEWHNNNARIELTGRSSFEGAVDIAHLDAFMSGACSMHLSGRAGEFDIMALGASHMKDEDFECDYLEADLSGASSLRLTVNKELEVDADGGSTVYYRGNGIVTHQDLDGGSSIVKF